MKFEFVVRGVHPDYKLNTSADASRLCLSCQPAGNILGVI